MRYYLGQVKQNLVINGNIVFVWSFSIDDDGNVFAKTNNGMILIKTIEDYEKEMD